MIIKDAIYETEMVERNVLKSEVVYGCDECENKIHPNEEQGVLRLSIFYKGMEETDHKEFCCWGCVLKYIPKIESDYFVDLPFLHFDSPKENKCSVHEFIRLTSK